MQNEIFENQKQLLQAIFNTDYKKSSHSLLCVYDMRDSERLIAIFVHSKDCARFLGLTEASINSDVNRGHWVRKRYKLVRIFGKRNEYEWQRSEKFAK